MNRNQYTGKASVEFLSPRGRASRRDTSGFVRAAKRRRSTLALWMAVVCLLMPASCLLHAQSFYGSIVGTVTDSSGNLVPDATVTITNLGTSEVHTVKTNASGEYSVVNLVPANYKVEISKENFKRFVRNSLGVEVGSAIRVDAPLAIGAVTETVEVTTQAPLLQTDSSGMSQVIEGVQVQETPLNGRNMMNMITLAPGVVAQGSTSGNPALSQHGDHTSNQAWNNYQVGGSIAGEAATYVDGAPVNVLGQNIVSMIVTQDAIQEFSVSSSNANSDFGRYGGGVINMTTKSGGNQFHGTVYEYIRNAAFNANGFFLKQQGLPRPEDNQNQFGVAVTGPIKNDKLFFLFTWEGFKDAVGQFTPSEVPTTAMQQGIFSDALYGVTATQTTAYTDPTSGCIIDGPATTGNPHPGSWFITNLYTTTTTALGHCGDPSSKILSQYYPAPNSTTVGANYANTPVVRDSQYQYNGRLDYALSAKQRLFARYTYWTINDTGLNTFNNANGFPTENAYSVNYSQQAVVGDTYTLNAKTVLDVRADWTREYYPNLPYAQNINEAQFGAGYGALAAQESLNVIPVYTLTGSHNISGVTSATTFSKAYYNNYVLSANLIRLTGNHSFKFGFEGRLMDQSGTGTDSQASSALTYTTAYSGDEFANFLLGYPTSGAIQTFNSTTAYNYYQAYYATDTWQARRNLTLDLGIRYELPGGIAEKNNKATVLLPTAVDPYTGITGTLGLVDSGLYPHRPTVLPAFNLLAPHVGFIFRPETSFAIRGGYTISYLPPDIQGGSTGILPFSSLINSGTTTFTNTTTPTIFTDNPFPSGITQPTGRSNPAFMKSYINQPISGAIPNQKYGYIQQWNLELSKEFKGNWLLDVGYAGSKGTHMPGIGTTTTVGQNINELNSSFYSQGATLLTAGSCAAKASISSITVGQCDQPYSYYKAVVDTADWKAYTNYNSLQVKLTKRFGSAGELLANYTFSKEMGNTDTQIGTAETKATTSTRGGGYGEIQDFNNLSGEYSILSYNVPHRAVVSYVYDLPFGRNKHWGSNLSGGLNALVSGWNVSGITTFQSGFPLDITEGTASPLTTNFGGGILRPSVVPGCNKKLGGSALSRVPSTSNPSAKWFNTACFEYPTGPNPVGYNFGNEPRVDPVLYSEGVDNFDFAVEKGTNVVHGVNLKFRAEFFNLFNRVQFSPPYVASANPASATTGATQSSTSTFGEIASQSNNPRQIQFSLRLSY